MTGADVALSAADLAPSRLGPPTGRAWPRRLLLTLLLMAGACALLLLGTSPASAEQADQRPAVDATTGEDRGGRPEPSLQGGAQPGGDLAGDSATTSPPDPSDGDGPPDGKPSDDAKPGNPDPGPPPATPDTSSPPAGKPSDDAEPGKPDPGPPAATPDTGSPAVGEPSDDTTPPGDPDTGPATEPPPLAPAAPEEDVPGPATVPLPDGYSDDSTAPTTSEVRSVPVDEAAPCEAAASGPPATCTAPTVPVEATVLAHDASTPQPSPAAPRRASPAPLPGTTTSPAGIADSSPASLPLTPTAPSPQPPVQPPVPTGHGHGPAQLVSSQSTGHGDGHDLQLAVLSDALSAAVAHAPSSFAGHSGAAVLDAASQPGAVPD